MLETYYVGLIVSAILILNGVFMILISGITTKIKIIGMALVLLAGFVAGALLEPNKAGIPVNTNSIASFKELRIVKRIDRSLSVVKLVDGSDERIVRGIPEHVLKGEVFMVREDGTVIILKNTTLPIDDGE